MGLFTTKTPATAPAPTAGQPARRSPRPMEAVIRAIHGGARSRADIRKQTGLSDSMVDAVVHHLQRIGHLTLEELGSSCAGGACSSCIAAKANGGGCATRPGGSSGPVALVLTRKIDALQG